MNLHRNDQTQFASGTPALSPQCKSDRRETSDDYRGELHRHGDHRVIVCKSDLQWIVQHTRTANQMQGGVQWQAIAYVTTRDALINRWVEETGAHAAELLALPENFRSAGVMV